DAAELRNHRRRRAAAERAGIKQREAGIRHHQAYAFEKHAQFVSNGLRNRSANVLAHFGLAGETRNYPVFANVQPGSDFFKQFFIMESTRPSRSFLRCDDVSRHSKHGDARAKKFEEFAAGQIEFIDGSGAKFEAFRFDGETLSHRVHWARSRLIWAACCTASMTSRCVPQRQMLRCRK